MTDARRAVQRRLADADALIRIGSGSLDAADRLTMLRAIERRALTLLQDDRPQAAAAEYARIIAQFDGTTDEDARWRVAAAYVQRTRLLVALGDEAAATETADAGDASVGDLIRPSEGLAEEQLERGCAAAEARRYELALEHFANAIGGHEPDDAPVTAIEGVRLSVGASVTAGRGTGNAREVCDLWLAHADDSHVPERRAAYGWLFATKAWLHACDRRNDLAVRVVDAALAYVGDDPDPAYDEIREHLQDERARRSELVGDWLMPRPARHTRSAIPPHVLPRMSPQNEARLLARRWTRNPTVAARRERLAAIVRSRGELEEEELQLLVFCAYRRVLDLSRRDDHHTVKSRLKAVGRRRDPSPVIRDLMDRLLVEPGDGAAFAEALLPHRLSWSAASDPVGYGGGGGSGGDG